MTDLFSKLLPIPVVPETILSDDELLLRESLLQADAYVYRSGFRGTRDQYLARLRFALARDLELRLQMAPDAVESRGFHVWMSDRAVPRALFANASFDGVSAHIYVGEGWRRERAIERQAEG